MNRAARQGGITAGIAAFWSARNKRERVMLGAALAAVLLGLFYLLLIDPALSGRERLQKTLPALRQQAAELQVLAKQAAGASGKATAPAQPLTQEALEASLARSGLKAQRAVLSGDTATVELSAVSFASIVEWLTQLQSSTRWAVAEGRVTGQDQAETVNATFTLRQQRGE